ncbi:MAG: RNA ligase, Rnl2 family [Desulfobacterales bacterium]|nr:RNA ligase, Rnl2 family [Desulfobacterales bacterium]
MIFRKYNSIENVQRQKLVEQMQIEHNDIEYYVQEKIHGSNFSFYYDGNIVKCAKRTSFIEDNEDFYGSEVIKLKYEKNIIELFNHLKNKMEVDSIVVFGELYGGTYPHKDVDKTKASRVQKGVYYSPDLEFAVFDIKINDDFVSLDEMVELCSFSELPLIPVLKKGSLLECLEYNNTFSTTVPGRLHNLPEIDDNICEGVVIKPLSQRFFRTGSRVILKNKNEKFSEKKPRRTIDRTLTEVPENIKILIEEANRYITENRLKNVLSKTGSVKKEEFGKLLGMFCKDIFEDFSKDFEEFKDLDKKDRKRVTGTVNRNAANLIRPQFMNIIDGNF